VDLEVKIKVREEEEKSRVFIPYFNRINFTGQDNVSVLLSNNLDLNVVILGTNERFIIYPFGDAIIPDKFESSRYDAYLYDVHGGYIGNMILDFTKENEIYIFECTLKHCKDDNDKNIKIGNIRRPFFLKMDVELKRM
jgi:hypothetical protein